MKLRFLFVMGVALGVVASGSAQWVTVFDDTEMPAGDYETAFVVARQTGTVANATVSISNSFTDSPIFGNNEPGRTMDSLFTIQGTSHGSVKPEVITYHTNIAHAWLLSSSAISEVTMRADIFGPQTGYYFALGFWQGGQRFVKEWLPTVGGFATIELNGLDSSEWGVMDGPTGWVDRSIDFGVHPDFSTSGEKLEFTVFTVQDETWFYDQPNFGPQEYSQRFSLDNFRVEVNSVPEPFSAATLGLGAVALLRRRRTRKAI